MKEENFLEVVTNAYKRLFAGRVRRKVFWQYVLIYYLVIFGCMGFGFFIQSVLRVFIFGSLFSLAGGLFSIFCAIPNIAIQARRLHDTGKSAWFMLLPIAPYIMFVVLGIITREIRICTLLGFLSMLVIYIVLYAKDSEPGENKYGPNPKEPIVPPAMN